MAEKKKWAPTKMFLQWCLSYLLISVIALTLLLASGYRYLDVLRDNLEYTNGIQLDMTRVWLDQKVKLLRNITAKESSTAAIEAVRQTDDYDDIPRYVTTAYEENLYRCHQLRYRGCILSLFSVHGCDSIQHEIRAKPSIL